MLPLSDDQRRVIQTITKAAPGSRCILIGAAAVLHHVDLPRTTCDLDFAVIGHRESLLRELEAEGWRRDSKVLQRWYVGEAQVDLIAATEDDIREGVTTLEDDFRLSLIGIELAMRQNTPVRIDDSTLLHVTELPTLVLLKMVAWLDRPQRMKDLGDIVRMLDLALPEVADCRFDAEHPVGAAEFDHDLQSAFYVGWELGKVAGPGDLVWAKKFLNIIGNEASSGFASLVREAAYVGDDADAMVRDRLGAFQVGLETGAGELRESDALT